MALYVPLAFAAFFEAVALLLCLLLVYRLFLQHRIGQSKVHLESAFDSIDDPLAIVTAEYKLLRVNSAYSSLVGGPFEKLLGQSCYAVLRGRTSPCEDCRLSEVLTSGTHLFVEQSPHPRSDYGTTISLTFYPFVDKKGECVSGVEHIRDTTQLERLKSDLEGRNRALTETAASLQKAREMMEDELYLARQVQQGLMPEHPPEFAGLKVSHMYRPTEAVGGDVYDFIPFTKHTIGIFIGDVSGHGLSAALVGTIIKISLYHRTSEGLSGNQLLKQLNHDLITNVHTAHYLTCLWAVFDARDNSLTYTKAGHPMPVVLRKDQAPIQLAAHGTFLGIIDKPVLEQKKFYLRKGDRCIMFTDGIYEFSDPASGEGRMYAFDRFMESVVAARETPLAEFIPAIRKGLSSCVHDDDYTLIALDVTENRPQNPSESLPGFTVADDTSLFSFYSMDEADEYLLFLAGRMRANAMCEKTIKRADLCTRELVANALRHGHRNLPDGVVTVAHAFIENGLKICVLDEGDGFDMQNVPDPTAEGNLTRENGRGLHIVRAYAEKLMQNPSGNAVTIFFNRDEG